MIRTALDLLQQELPPSTFLALIPEDSLIRQMVRKHLVDRILPHTEESLINLEDRNGSETTLADIRGLVSESPLFGGMRLVWIEQGDKIGDLSEQTVGTILKKPHARSLIVIEVKEKMGQELAALIPVFRMGWSKLSAQKEQEFQNWVLALGKKRGLSITTEAANTLNHHFDGHLGLVDQWLEKVVSSLGKSDQQKPPTLINPEFLLRSEEKIEDPLQTVFQLFSGWEEHDERILRDWRRFAGKSGSPLGILSLWHRQWRLYTLGNILAADSKGIETLAETEKLSPYRAKKIMETARKLTRPTLKKGYALLTQTDLLMKSGANADVAMDRFHLEMWALSPKGQKPTNRSVVRKAR